MKKSRFSDSQIKVFICIFATIFIFGGRTAMADHIIKIKWEWPAGRQPEAKLLINIEKISKSPTGFLGIGASTSLADSIPDATDVVATVLSGQDNLVGARHRQVYYLN